MTDDSKRTPPQDDEERPPLTIEGNATETSLSTQSAESAEADAPSEPYRDIGGEAAAPGAAAKDAKPGISQTASDPSAATPTAGAASEEQIAAAIEIRPGDDSEPILLGEAEADTVRPEPTIDIRPGEEPSLASEPSSSDAELSASIDARPDAGLDSVGAVPPIEDEPADSFSPLPPPRSRGGFFGHMAAGLLGGVIGVLATGVAWPWIENQLQIEPDGAQITQIEARLAQLEAQAAEPGETGSTPPSADLGAMDARIDEKLAPIREQVAGLGRAEPSGSNEQIGALAARVEALAKAPAPASEVAPKVEALDDKAVALDQRAAALDKRVAALEAKIPDVAAKVNANAAESRNAALAIAVANLRSAVASGKPYQNELNSLKSLARDDLDLETLEARAGNGVPTQPELAQRFAASASAAKKSEARAIAENRSWGGRLVENARSLVKVRRNGEEEAGSESTVTALDRAEDWLKGGDLAQAAHEVEQLQGPAAQAMNGWLGSARARLATDDALGKLQRPGPASASAGGPRR